MIPSAEAKIQRRLTEEFIAADIVTIELSRRPRTPNGAGGVKTGSPVSVAAQKFRLIPSGDGAAERMTADGRAVTPSYMLMGEYNANMQRFDEFELDGRRYQIVFINANRAYETKGEAAYLGE